MARKPIIKELENTRLLKEYASWIYCTGCNKTVAYLCYVTYDLFDFEFTCNCGSCGKVHIEFAHKEPEKSAEKLKEIKNRLCCPNDASPLLTLVEKNLAAYQFEILCNSCGQVFETAK
jgi:hypothetical protein